MANTEILFVALVSVIFLEVVDLKRKHDDPFGVKKILSRKKRNPQSELPLGNLLENMMAVEAHNSLFEKGEVSFKMKLNKFAFEDPQTFSLLRNGFINFFGRTVTIPGLIRFVEKALDFVSPFNSAFTATVDWRCNDPTCGVKDQLDCASCWAFSALGAIEGQIHARTGINVRLSEQNLIDCATGNYGSNGCQGGIIEGAYMYIEEHGVSSEIDYPYEGQQGICRHLPVNAAIRISGFRRIEAGNETQLLEAVASAGPVSAAMDASRPSFQFYSEGVYYDPECSSTNLDHGVLVVGYGTTLGGFDYWLIKNSYGDDWGEDGYFRLARNRNNACGIASTATIPIIMA